METPHLDSEIRYLKRLVDEIPTVRNSIKEYEAIKEALSIHSVSQRYTIEDIERCVENWGLCKVEKEHIEKFLNVG